MLIIYIPYGGKLKRSLQFSTIYISFAISSAIATIYREFTKNIMRFKRLIT